MAKMVKRVIYVLLLVGVIGLCYLGYNNWRQKRAMLSGDVLGGPSDTPDSSGADRSIPLPATTTGPAPQAAYSAPKASAATSSPAPSTDSMTPNPPNGLAYSGSGHFQVYRQGNLTYRINTDTGQTCVLYATNEEWRKPQVYSHGCGNTAAQ